MQTSHVVRAKGQLPGNTMGFTLVELLVIVSIIAILTSAAVMSFVGSNQSGRDLERQVGLRELETALESYRRIEGRYPEGCNGPDVWSTEQDCFQYIEDFWPDYILNLPRDPQLRGDGTGFAYRTNTDGTVYKLMVRGTVETEEVDGDHSLAPCPERCGCDETSSTYQTSFAVWGGFAENDSDTQDVVCRL